MKKSLKFTLLIVIFILFVTFMTTAQDMMYSESPVLTEMVDAGVDISQIMSVTGHTNIGSVQPYIKNTFTSANYALTTRKMHDISTYKCHRGE